jgi:simple sugar transport system permease protein
VQTMAKKLLKRSELYIAFVLAALCLVIQLRSGQFFTPNNLVDIASAMIVPGLFAAGAFMVLVSGGIDVSFPALASLSTYATTKILWDRGYTGGMLLPMVMVIAMGAVLGAFNGLFIGYLGLPALIVTLGSSSVFVGLMQGALASVQLATIPPGMEAYGTSSLFVATNPVSGLTSRMPTAFLFLAAVYLLVFLLMRYTYFGRGIYAIGGNQASAHRAGINVKRTKFLLYVLVGMTASAAGLIRTCMMQQNHPTNMLGMEMNIIAGVVLGGTAITGGAGSVTGCLLGTALIVIVENSLILIGVPTVWKRVFVGALIVAGTGISAWQVMRANRIRVSRHTEEALKA